MVTEDERKSHFLNWWFWFYRTRNKNWYLKTMRNFSDNKNQKLCKNFLWAGNTASLDSFRVAVIFWVSRQLITLNTYFNLGNYQLKLLPWKGNYAVFFFFFSWFNFHRHYLAKTFMKAKCNVWENLDYVLKQIFIYNDNISSLLTNTFRNNFNSWQTSESCLRIIYKWWV